MTETFELILGEDGRLKLLRPGQEEAADVRIRRAFPWSNPTRYISVRGSDGKELLLIEDLNSVAPEQRRLIEQSLAAGTFIPRITRIERIDLRFGHQQWKVLTDRGPAAFRVQEREDIRFLGDGRFCVKDADGNIYELPRLDELDEHSRRQMEHLV